MKDYTTLFFSQTPYLPKFLFLSYCPKYCYLLSYQIVGFFQVQWLKKESSYCVGFECITQEYWEVDILKRLGKM